MTNLEYLKSINAPIVSIDHSYYAFVPAVYGLHQGYDKGIYLYLNDESLEESSIKEFINSLSEAIEPFVNPEEDFVVQVPEDLDNRFGVIEKDFEVQIPEDLDSGFGAKVNYIDDSLGSVYSYDIVMHKDTCMSVNYEYYAKLNEIASKFEFTEDEVNSFNSTFAKIILYYAYVTDISTKTQIYKKVLEFFANGMVDDTLSSLYLILTSTSLTYVMNTNMLSNSCGCSSNSTSSGSPTAVQSCPDAYVEAMKTYVKQMFGDIDFYDNFMFLDTDEPNEELIQHLIDLITALMSLEYPMNFSETSRTHCCCPNGATKNAQAYSILSNYLKVLEWVKNCEIEQNINKIKLYGEQFGEIFPYLTF